MNLRLIGDITNVINEQIFKKAIKAINTKVGVFLNSFRKHINIEIMLLSVPNIQNIIKNM